MLQPYGMEERDTSPHGFYKTALEILKRAGVRFLVGGAYAFEHYTGIVRRTKDLDIFVHPRDCARALAILAGAGYETELTSPVWLAKARCGDHFIDIIFSSANGIATVDDAWFEHAAPGRIFDLDVMVCAPEEIIWSKGFIMNRDRYDGADIAHILRAVSPQLDWGRLMDRFGPNWRVLLSHLTLFGFIYPDDRLAIPVWVMEDLMFRLVQETNTIPIEPRLCRGTLLSMNQYLIDVEQWGYIDARLKPYGSMTRDEVETLIAED